MSSVTSVTNNVDIMPTREQGAAGVASISSLRVNEVASRNVGPVSFSLEGPQCLCISGESGSGKSQLLRAIADIDDARGEVWLNGVARSAMPAPQWRRQVTLLPAENHWWFDRVGAHFFNPAAPWLEAWLDRLALAPLLMQREPGGLSSGERQRMALIRVLQYRPRVLLLDEPTANLDPDSGRRVEDLIGDYSRNEGAPIIWVSHDVAQLARVADQHYRLEAGHLHRLD